MPFWTRAATLLFAGLATTTAFAAYPEKPIRLVIGFPAGGPLDQHARLLSERLQQVLGQPIVIDYKAGAGGTVGAQDVMKAPAGLPNDIKAKLSDAFRQVMSNPEIRSRMVAQGADPAFLGSEDFAKFLNAEMPRWADAVKKSGARLD